MAPGAQCPWPWREPKCGCYKDAGPRPTLIAPGRSPRLRAALGQQLIRDLKREKAPFSLPPPSSCPFCPSFSPFPPPSLSPLLPTSSLQLPPFSLDLTKNYARHTGWDYDPILQLGKGEAQRGAGTCSCCFPVPFLPRPTKQRPAPGLPKWILARTLIFTNHVALLGNKTSLFDSKSCHGQLPSGQQSCSKGPGRGERILRPGCSGRSCSCLHLLLVTSIQLPCQVCPACCY